MSLNVHIMVYFYYLVWDSYSKHYLKNSCHNSALPSWQQHLLITVCCFQHRVLKTMPAGTCRWIQMVPCLFCHGLAIRQYMMGSPCPDPRAARVACESQQSSVCPLSAEQPAVIKCTYHMNRDVPSALGRLAQTIYSIIHHETAHLLALYNLVLL